MLNAFFLNGIFLIPYFDLLSNKEIIVTATGRQRIEE